MKTSFAVAGSVGAIVAITLLAVPAVANGADYLASSPDASAFSIYGAATEDPVAGATAASASGPISDLSGLITAWGAGGVLLFGGGAVAVAASVRRQRKLVD